MLKLPAVISDGMVLEKKGALWGWAAPGETVRITFNNQTVEAAAQAGGRWRAALPEADYGGPYTLSINEITISDIYIGYVWLCGGQSNMELPVARVRRAFEAEIAAVNNPRIRAYIVGKGYKFDGPEQIGGGRWLAAVPEQIDGFYAAAFFFAARIYERYGVPVGLLCCAAGGSTAEAWLRAESLGAFPEALEEFKLCATPGHVKNTEQADMENARGWRGVLDAADKGLALGWESETLDDGGWPERMLTAPWERDLPFNGSVWFRKTVEIPEDCADALSGGATLYLGRIVDNEYVYVNGAFAGRIEYQYPPRIFKLPPGMLKAGNNVIAVRVISERETGGFMPDKPYRIVLNESKAVINLDGLWKYKTGAVMPPLPPSTFFYAKPAGLYNAMLAQLVGYTLSGALWYQGETNTHTPYNYFALMKTLIEDWRALWGADFPFIFTQLANYEARSAAYPDSLWAELREQQRMCLSVPDTAMACAIDCGEYNDLHPLDKKTVGGRLALAALALVFGEEIRYSGPAPDCITVQDGVLTIAFLGADGGLVVDEARAAGGLGFEIETAGNVWRPVDAQAGGECVKISLNGQTPLGVRYGWADNPPAPLYNRFGLPMPPFRLRV